MRRRIPVKLASEKMSTTKLNMIFSTPVTLFTPSLISEALHCFDKRTFLPSSQTRKVTCAGIKVCVCE